MSVELRAIFLGLDSSPNAKYSLSRRPDHHYSHMAGIYHTVPVTDETSTHQNLFSKQSETTNVLQNKYLNKNPRHWHRKTVLKFYQKNTSVAVVYRFKAKAEKVVHNVFIDLNDELLVYMTLQFGVSRQPNFNKNLTNPKQPFPHQRKILLKTKFLDVNDFQTTAALGGYFDFASDLIVVLTAWFQVNGDLMFQLTYCMNICKRLNARSFLLFIMRKENDK